MSTDEVGRNSLFDASDMKTNAKQIQVLKAIDLGTYVGGSKGRFWTLDPIGMKMAIINSPLSQLRFIFDQMEQRVSFAESNSLYVLPSLWMVRFNWVCSAVQIFHYASLSLTRNVDVSSSRSEEKEHTRLVDSIIPQRSHHYQTPFPLAHIRFFDRNPHPCE